MDSDEGRNKGIRKDDGRIFKGTLTEAPTKMKASSIPSKIENVVFSNHHKASFGNSQERFYTRTVDTLSSTPGPANYNPSALKGKVDSKKGLGFLASQTKLDRFNDKRNWNPGPGRYEVQRQAQRMKTRSTALLSTSIQSRDLFKNELQSIKHNPGPGNYEERLFRSNSAAAPAFKNKNQRFLNVLSDSPGVGHYNCELIRNKINSLKFPSSNTSTIIDQKKHFAKKYYDKLMGGVRDPVKEVGPGKYNPVAMESRRTFSIRSSPKGRFGTGNVLRDGYEGDYQIVESSPVVDHRGSAPFQQVNSHGSVFKSKNKRYEFGEAESKQVGDPWRYSPTKGDKGSHLVNFAQKWV